VPLGDVKSTYADIVESVLSTTIGGQGVARDRRRHARRRAGADRIAHVREAPACRSSLVPDREAHPSLVGKARRAPHDSGVLPLRHELGFKTLDARVAVHSIAGSFVYGVLAAKLLVIRQKGYPHWVLPVLGGSLAAFLTTLWLTSALWYFTNVRFGF
jgi:Family of unknown function (DUF6529)